MRRLGILWSWIAIAILLVPWVRCWCPCHEGLELGLRPMLLESTRFEQPPAGLLDAEESQRPKSESPRQECHCDDHRTKRDPSMVATDGMRPADLERIQDTTGRPRPTATPEPLAAPPRARGSPGSPPPAARMRRLSALRSTVLHL